MKERATSRNSKQQQEAHSNGELLLSKSKLKSSKWIDPNASWDKEELLDVLYWIRQAVALVLGIIWGCIPLVGFIWLPVFLAVSSGIVYGHYKFILRVDEEDFGGHGTLLQDGLFTSAMLFLLSWILVYSLLHF